MAYKLETAGNALLTLFEDEKPVLATDPWLEGTCYFGSWALDFPLTDNQIRNVCASKFIWISHGHPDHLHPESLKRLPRNPGPRILIPDHYCSEIREYLESENFTVQVLKFKRWTRLTPTLRVMCLEDMNQDAMLIIEAGDTLIIDKNDAPNYGEEKFLRKLVRGYEKSYLLALCAMDADMLNYVDEQGAPLLPEVQEAKQAVIELTSEFCTYLGVKTFCCFSSQHVYVRSDSAWANSYRVLYSDMQRYWTSRTRLIEPHVTLDLENGSFVATHPNKDSEVNLSNLTTGDDDWNEPMNSEDWNHVAEFIGKIKILEPELDFVRFTVAGESRTFYMRSAQRLPAAKQRGINFFVPRNSLVETAKSGYFDDLLIGNFMKTQLINMKLYPKFSPYIAKYAGSSKVFTGSQLMKFYLHYFSLSPIAFIRWHFQAKWTYSWRGRTKNALRVMGLLEVAKALSRRNGRAAHPRGME
jgi:hypothetical protein